MIIIVIKQLHRVAAANSRPKFSSSDVRQFEEHFKAAHGNRCEFSGGADRMQVRPGVINKNIIVVI